MDGAAVTDGFVPVLNAPIVLVHGVGGLNHLRPGRKPPDRYFPGVRQHLAGAGNRVYVARVSPTSGVERRAGDLKRFIERTVPRGPVHLVGHSMGGLDARYMTSRLGMADRVLSVTTVGTPHRGTAFADWGWSRLAAVTVPFLRLMGVSCQAFWDLKTDVCRRFNELVPDAPGVRYFSVAGVCEWPQRGLEWLLPFKIVSAAEGPNDGVVSVASARWGEHTDEWAGDHLNLVNWPNRRARRRGEWACTAHRYGAVVRRLAAAGF